MPNGDIELHINGYRSLTFGKGKFAVLREAMAGSVAWYFTDRHSQLLTLGLGSGITAGAAANLYQQVTVAEINPTMLVTAARFSDENDALLDKPNVKIHIQDGLITLLESSRKYDAIINTVPTPRYFSANKLWTTDVFEAVKTRLTHSGVYVGWVDSRLGKTGIEIMQKSLRKSFEHCLYLYLTSGYFVFICSPDELKFKADSQIKSMPAIDRILSQSNWSGSTDEFFRTMLFASSSQIMPDTGINSIDKPLLEFVHHPDGIDIDVFRSFTRLLGRDPFDDGIKTKLCEALRLVEPLNTVDLEKWCRKPPSKISQ